MMICDDVESIKSRLSVAQLYGGVVNMGVDVPLDACKLNLHQTAGVHCCQYTFVETKSHYEDVPIYQFVFSPYLLLVSIGGS